MQFQIEARKQQAQSLRIGRVKVNKPSQNLEGEQEGWLRMRVERQQVWKF